MNIKIIPHKLSGKLYAVSSKSDAHRKIIASALSDVPTMINITEYSDDIDVTLSAIKSLGGDFEKKENGVLITPCKTGLCANIDCGESGSTARFLLPVSAAICKSATITGKGRLPLRPFSDLVREMQKNGTRVSAENLPITVSGGLKNGTYTLSGNVSSQYITGLLFALPLLKSESRIVLTSPLESAAYVDMTISTLNEFGVDIIKEENGFIIKPQKYISKGNALVEGDWSNAAFWIVADKLSGNIEVSGVNPTSMQGDKIISEILDDTVVDASQVPDLVPILAILACARKGKTYIKNAGRLRMKESDRISAMVDVITSLGGEACADSDSITVFGRGSLSGGTVDGHNDHRIVMSAAIASCICDNDVIILGSEAVNKSYPAFFEDFRKMGGVFDVV